ncbi:MAG: dockerin type I domain-containing protein [Candidatus Saccharibacteria bacterium]|nr:dockerin type I domain-containing protein [Candidatus Saccharibacteria bacterium]
MNKKIKTTSLICLAILMLSSINILHGEKAQAESGAEFPEEILEDEAYKDLPEDAKKLIKENYKKTQSLILTEKNKKAGKPYLNPKYAEYLGKSSEEREDITTIPETYVVDFQINTTYGASGELPSSYDLRNVNGKKYITDLKNQNELGICWAFGTIEQVESYLMLHDEDFYANPTKFSTRQMDYAVAANSLTDLATNPEALLIHDQNGNLDQRKLGDSANYFYSSSIMTRGLSLVDEAEAPWDNLLWTKNELIKYPTLEKSQVLNYGNSLYEVNATIDNQVLDSSMFPNEYAWAGAKSAFVDIIKGRIMEYGGAHVGTQAPNSSCSASNLKAGVYNGTRIINPDDHCVEDSGHSMQIIGWDDNYEYEYTYCAGSGKYAGAEIHNYKDGVCSGELQTVSGTGAWLLRNSWKNKISYDYVWLAYDATMSTINYATNITRMSERNWDKVYANSMSDTLAADGEFGPIHIVEPEKLQKIKFQTMGTGITYIVFIEEEGRMGPLAVVPIDTEEPGYYTVDLEALNLVEKNKNITIKIADNYCQANPTETCDPVLFVDSIELFTKSQTLVPEIETEEDEIVIPESELVSSTEFYKFRPYSTTKNISSNSEITYKLFDLNDNDMSNYFNSIKYNIVATNDVFPEILVSGTIPEGVYKLKATYGSAESIITIAIGYAHLPSGLEIVFNEGIYDDEKSIVDQVPQGMSMDVFLATIMVGDDYYVSNIEDQKVKTGAKIKLYDFENHLLKEIKIIVRGDVDGDGIIDPLDYVKVRKQIMGTTNLDGVYLKAADCNNDNVVDILDYIKLRNQVSPNSDDATPGLNVLPESLTIYVDKNEEISILGTNCAGKVNIESLDSKIATVSKAEIFADKGITEKIAINGVSAGTTKIRIYSESLASYSGEMLSKIDLYVNIVVLDEPGKGGNNEKPDKKEPGLKPQTIHQSGQLSFSDGQTLIGLKNNLEDDTKKDSGHESESDKKKDQESEQEESSENSITLSEIVNIILAIVVVCETATIIVMTKE